MFQTSTTSTVETGSNQGSELTSSSSFEIKTDLRNLITTYFLKVVPGNHACYAIPLTSFIIEGPTFSEDKISSAELVKMKASELGLKHFQVKTGLETGIKIGLIENTGRTSRSHAIHLIRLSQKGTELKEALRMQDEIKIKEICSNF